MRTGFSTLGVACTALLVASAAGAHPGHGLDGGSTSWLHYLGDPLHVAPLALVAFTLALAWRQRRGVRASRREARARTR
jgi:hypothetical protein